MGECYVSSVVQDYILGVNIINSGRSGLIPNRTSGLILVPDRKHMDSHFIRTF